MDVILLSVKWLLAALYSDEIIVFLKTIDIHLFHLHRLLKLLNNAWVILRSKGAYYSKWQSSSWHTSFDLEDRNTRNQWKKQAAKSKVPTTEIEVQVFLNLQNVFRRFVPRSWQIASPLNKKSGKERPKFFADLATRNETVRGGI